jgi:hypothetical protein
VLLPPLPNPLLEIIIPPVTDPFFETKYEFLCQIVKFIAHPSAEIQTVLIFFNELSYVLQHVIASLSIAVVRMFDGFVIDHTEGSFMNGTPQQVTTAAKRQNVKELEKASLTLYRRAREQECHA